MTEQRLHPAELLAVCAGDVEDVGEGRRRTRSGIRKSPLDPPVTIDADGVPGDRIADLEHHGGPDQALYLYADEDAAWWEEELDRELPFGAFGENLRVSGMDVTFARIGAHWRIGDELEIVIAAPRIPCHKLAAAWDQPDIVERFLTAGRPGAYAKVVAPGTVQPGDPIEVLSRPYVGTLTVQEVASILTRQRHRAEELVHLPDLAHRPKDWAAERVGRTASA